MRHALFQRGLQRVVVRIPDRVLGKDTGEDVQSIRRAADAGCGFAKWRGERTQAYQINIIGQHGAARYERHRPIGQVQTLRSNRGSRGNNELIVGFTRPARSRTKCGDDIETSLRIAEIQIMRNQQTMSLRSHVADRRHKVVGKLMLDAKVVLVGVLRSQLGLQLAEK